MSAYVVEPNTISDIVNFAFLISTGSFWKISVPLPLIEAARDPERPAEFDCRRLFEALLAMNIEAVNQRYDEAATRQDYPAHEYNFRLGALYPDRRQDCIRVFVRLGEFSYQCAEGNVPKTTLYKAIEEFRARIAEHVVYSLADELFGGGWSVTPKA